jgi:hypothetical protein
MRCGVMCAESRNRHSKPPDAVIDRELHLVHCHYKQMHQLKGRTYVARSAAAQTQAPSRNPKPRNARSPTTQMRSKHPQTSYKPFPNTFLCPSNLSELAVKRPQSTRPLSDTNSNTNTTQPTKPTQLQKQCTSPTSSSQPASAIITTALAATTAQGTVLYFNPVRDYGFITPDDGSAQVSLSRASFKVRSFPEKKRI